MARRSGLVLAALPILAISACNPAANLGDADQRIEQFHAGYERGDRASLYAMTGPQFRSAASQAQFEEMLEVVKVRLGKFQTSERISFNVNSTTNGTFTSVKMKTAFAKGEATEDFVFRGSGDDMLLEGWHINSPRLMLTADDVADERGAKAEETRQSASLPPSPANND
jgi:hypothetical protein